MEVSKSFNDALAEVARCASAEVKRLKEENQRYRQLLEKADKGGNSLEHPLQPEAEPVTEAPHMQETGSMSSMSHSDPGNLKQIFKQRTRKSLEEETPHDVTDEYYKTGFFQLVAKSSYFENTTLAVVVLNGIWIAVDVDYHTPETQDSKIWVIMDNFFCTYFTMELVMRFGAFRRKHRVFCDGWFVFDFVLVLMMVVETWVLPLVALITGASTAGGGDAQVLRLLRLLRLSRMAKMMKSLPELMILIKGTVVGIRSVAITLVLLGGITAVFAIAMRTLTDGTEVGHESFSSVPGSMYTLMVEGVMPDNGALMTDLGATQWYFALMFFLFIFLAALTFMNMLIGILCDAVHGVSEDEKEEMHIQHMRDALYTGFSQNDDFIHTNRVTLSLVVSVIQSDEDVWASLSKLDVDIPSLSDNLAGIFRKTEGQSMDFDDFVDVLLKFRATDQAMIKAICDLRALVHADFTLIQHKLDKLVTHSETDPNPVQTPEVEHVQSGPVMMELEKIQHMFEPVNTALTSIIPIIQRGGAASLQSRQSTSNGELQSTSPRNGLPPSQVMPELSVGRASPRTMTARSQMVPTKIDNSGSQTGNGIQPVAPVPVPAAVGVTGVLPPGPKNLGRPDDEEMPLLGNGVGVAHNAADLGANPVQSQIVYHNIYFEEQVEELQFRIAWDTEQPVTLAVKPGGESERRGMRSGDILVEINHSKTLGRTREELLPILAVRPLHLKVERHHQFAPV